MSSVKKKLKSKLSTYLIFISLTHIVCENNMHNQSLCHVKCGFLSMLIMAGWLLSLKYRKMFSSNFITSYTVAKSLEHMWDNFWNNFHSLLSSLRIPTGVWKCFTMPSSPDLESIVWLTGHWKLFTQKYFYADTGSAAHKCVFILCLQPGDSEGRPMCKLSPFWGLHCCSYIW